MWIVKLALRQPYTFAVLAILILIIGVFTITRMPTDILPVIDIPVVTVIWAYGGITPNDMEKRFVTQSERAYTTTVNDIEHIESQSVSGIGIVKIYFQPNANLSQAIAQVTASSQTILRAMPPGTQPPSIIRYDASDVPILQAAVSGKSESQSQLFDYAQNFIRTQLATVQGAQILAPYGGQSRQLAAALCPRTIPIRCLICY
jgi:multidrug efflux pump subunit AcrB